MAHAAAPAAGLGRWGRLGSENKWLVCSPNLSALHTSPPSPLQDTGLVVKHIESWDVEPGRVVRQLLKPSAKVPGTMVRAGEGAGQKRLGGWAGGCLVAMLPAACCLLLMFARYDGSLATVAC